jgi:hypothetical protein
MDAALPRVCLFMLLSRRVFPQVPSDKLNAHVEFADLPVVGHYNRVLADVEMTASLLTRRKDKLQGRYKISGVSHELLHRNQRVSKHHFSQCLERLGLRLPQNSSGNIKFVK